MNLYIVRHRGPLLFLGYMEVLLFSLYIYVSSLIVLSLDLDHHSQLCIICASTVQITDKAFNFSQGYDVLEYTKSHIQSFCCSFVHVDL
jgi:hypothetical protein